MPGPLRFKCPSASLSLGPLLSRTRKVTWIGFGLAVGIHLLSTGLGGRGEEASAPRPLTTQFVKRQPRLSKPLELKKRPQPKPRLMQREMISVKTPARRHQQGRGFRPSDVSRRLARPEVMVGRETFLGAAVLEPEATAGVIEGEKEAKDITDMPLDMLDIDALDTGRYWALVVQDPIDKRAMKGFLHLASAYPASMPRPGSETGPWPIIIKPLIDAMNRFTDIRTDCQGKIGFDSRELLKLPFLYTRIWWVFRLTSSESERLGTYLTDGGFLFAETIPPGQHRWLPAYEGVKEMVSEALSTRAAEQNRDWSLERLPDGHPVYHCYFDFAGPPVGTEWLPDFRNVDHLEGIMLGGRVAGILCQKNYALIWMEWERLYGKDPTRHLQFGVNLIVFALTQEGSITHQVMNLIH